MSSDEAGSDAGSTTNGTTNFIEDWGPDPWGLDAALHGSDDPGSFTLPEPGQWTPESILQAVRSGLVEVPSMIVQTEAEVVAEQEATGQEAGDA